MKKEKGCFHRQLEMNFSAGFHCYEKIVNKKNKTYFKKIQTKIEKHEKTQIFRNKKTKKLKRKINVMKKKCVLSSAFYHSFVCTLWMSRSLFFDAFFLSLFFMHLYFNFLKMKVEFHTAWKTKNTNSMRYKGFERLGRRRNTVQTCLTISPKESVFRSCRVGVWLLTIIYIPIHKQWVPFFLEIDSDLRGETLDFAVSKVVIVSLLVLTRE